MKQPKKGKTNTDSTRLLSRQVPRSPSWLHSLAGAVSLSHLFFFSDDRAGDSLMLSVNKLPLFSEEGGGKPDVPIPVLRIKTNNAPRDKLRCSPAPRPGRGSQGASTAGPNSTNLCAHPGEQAKGQLQPQSYTPASLVLLCVSYRAQAAISFCCIPNPSVRGSRVCHNARIVKRIFQTEIQLH